MSVDRERNFRIGVPCPLRCLQRCAFAPSRAAGFLSPNHVERAKRSGSQYDPSRGDHHTADGNQRDLDCECDARQCECDRNGTDLDSYGLDCADCHDNNSLFGFEPSISFLSTKEAKM